MASWKEALRRVYHELVERRSRVRVVSPRPVELAAAPIFLIGVYGSGTTLLRYVIDSHSRLCCPPESDFLNHLEPLLSDPRPRAGLAAMGFDEDHVTLRLRQLASELFGHYAASWNKPRWADKTPAYVDCLEFLHRLFPEARFLHLYRHGLDQAHSFTRGGTFPRPQLADHGRPDEDLRLGACRYWREKVEKMLAFEARHPASCYRLHYETLCARPEETLRPAFEFLGEPWESQVLRFWELPHDKGREHGRVQATRGFEAREGHYRSWSDDLLARCVEIAGPALERLGYSG